MEITVCLAIKITTYLIIFMFAKMNTETFQCVPFFLQTVHFQGCLS